MTFWKLPQSEITKLNGLSGKGKTERKSVTITGTFMVFFFSILKRRIFTLTRDFRQLKCMTVCHYNKQLAPDNHKFNKHKQNDGEKPTLVITNKKADVNVFCDSDKSCNCVGWIIRVHLVYEDWRRLWEKGLTCVNILMTHIQKNDICFPDREK